jgi:hypothetical protein
LKGKPIVFEVSDTHVASVAEQTTDALGIVAMVDMKASSASGARRSTDSALSLLGFQQSIELSGGKPISVFSPVVRMALWVSIAVSFLFYGGVHKVLAAPLVVTGNAAGLAVHLVAVGCALGLVELRKGLYGSAARAVLCSGREVEWLSTGHEYSFGVEYSYVRNTLYARAS